MGKICDLMRHLNLCCSSVVTPPGKVGYNQQLYFRLPACYWINTVAM